MSTKTYQVDSPYAWVVAFASLALATIGSGIFYLVGVAIVPQAATLEITVKSASLPYGAAMLGMGLGGIFMGWFSDRKGPFGPTLLGTLAIVSGSYLISTTNHFQTIVIIYGLLLGALGNAALVAPLLSNTMLWFNARRGVASAVVGAGNALGGAIWPPILYWWVTDYGVSSSYRIFALVALFTMPPLCIILRAKKPSQAMQESSPEKSQGKVKKLVFPPPLFVGLLSVAVVGCCVAMSMPMVHLPNYVNTKGFLLGEGAILLSILMTSSVAARIIWGFICDRLGGLKTLFLASSTQAIGLIGIAASDGMTMLYLGGIVFGIGFGGILPCYPVILREHLPTEGLGFRIGLVVLFGAIGMALGPEIAGRIYASLGNYYYGFATGIAANTFNLMIVATIIFFGVKKVEVDSLK